MTYFFPLDPSQDGRPARMPRGRRPRRAAGRSRPTKANRPALEMMEPRTLLSIMDWTNASGGSWDTAANWTNAANPGDHHVPTGSDNAVIGLNGVTVNFDAGNSDAVNTLSLASSSTLNISNGTLTINSASTLAGSLAMSNGTLNASGGVTLDGAASWTGGALEGAVTAAGTLTINGSVNLGAALGVTGTLDWAAGDILNDQNSSGSITVAAGGTLDAQSNNTIYATYYSGQQITGITVAGTLEKTASTGTTYIRVPFNVTGTVDASSGTVALYDGGSDSGAIAIASGAELTIPSATFTADAGATDTGAGLLVVSGGTLAVAQGATLAVPEFSLTDGTAGGPGALDLTGQSSWTNGALEGSVTVSGTLTIGNFVELGAALDVTGTLDWASGAIANDPSSPGSITVAAGGTFDAQSDSTIYATYYSGQQITGITVAGTLEKTASTGTTYIRVPFNVTGTVDVQTGAVSPNAGGTSTAGNFVVAKGATYDLTGGATYTYSGVQTASGGGTLLLSSGTLTSSSAGASFDAPAGMWQWTGGTMEGAVTDTGTLTIGGTVSLGAALDVTGTLDWASGDILNDPNSAGSITVAAGGTLDAQSNNTIYANYYSGQQISGLTVAGTFEKTASTGTTRVAVPFNVTGTVDVQTGTVSLTAGGSSTGPFQLTAGVMSIDGGTYTLSNGADETGAGTLRVGGGTLAVAQGGVASVVNSAVANGTAGGPGTLDLTGQASWTGGTMEGAVTDAGTLTISGTVNLGAALDVTGTLDWAGGDILNDPNSAGSITVAAAGILDAQSNNTIYATYYSGQQITAISVAGTFEKTASTGTTSVQVPFNVTGTVDVQTGTVSPSSGGTSTAGNFVVAKGATYDLTGGATYAYSGAQTASGGGTLLLSSGTLTSSSAGASFDAPAGMWQWTGGTMEGAVTDTGTLTIGGTVSLGAALDVTGTLDWASGDILNDQNSAGSITVAAGGTLDAQSNNTIYANYYSGQQISGITVAGTFEKTAGSNTTSIQVPFSSTGLTQVTSGTLSLSGPVTNLSSGTLTGGLWRVGAGSTLNLNANITTDDARIVLEGAGASFSGLNSVATVDFGALLALQGGASLATTGNLDNAGAVALSPGTLDVTGTYTQESSASLSVGIGGTTAGSQFGQLNATGQATLGGNLVINIINNDQPALGDVYQALSASSVAGSFAEELGLYFGGGLGFNPLLTPSANPTALDLAVVSMSATTKTSVQSSENPSTYGDPVTFTVTEQPQVSTFLDPGGAVTFFFNGNQIGQATITNGAASFTTSALPAGSDHVVVKYAGDTNFVGSDPVTFVQTVNQATPGVSWTAPAPITYGTALGNAQLDASATVPGSFTYTPAAGAVLHAGNNQKLSATFTPTDSVDYKSVTVSTTIDVAQATPTITWPTPSPIAYGTPLSSTQLDPGASWTVGGTGQAVPGTFTYTPAAGTVLPVGAGEMLSASFAPTDSTDYTTASGSTLIDVVKATPAFSGLSPSQDILPGTATIQLGGTIASNTPAIPTGDVSITIDGLTQTAAIQPDGSFSASFDTHAILASASPYTITYSYAAGPDFTAASDATTTLSVGAATIPPVTPNPRNTQVATVDVTFARPIDLATFTPSALSLTDNGGANLITNAVTIGLVSGSTYQIGGLGGLTTAQGQYALTINTTGMQDQSGHALSGTLSTSWLMDTTAPTSHVNALPLRSSSLDFSVSATGTDPSGPGNSPASGVASYDIYESTNGGPWTLWTTVPASQPSATYDGQSHTTYAFYSVAHDRAGNVESKSPTIEASTFVPDLTPPTTTIAGLSGSNPTTIDTATGTIALSLNGHDTGGSGLAYFQVYASVDGSAYQPVAWAIPAGVPDSSGNIHATYLYQGATDGQPHTYAFYSIGIDGAGNVEPTPAAAELSLNPTFAAAAPSQLGVAGLTVEHGAAERSYIRYLDLGFNESNAQSGGELANIVNSVVNNPNSPSAQDITLYRYSLSGTGTPTRVSLPTTLKVIDHAIEIDFGAGGIGGAPNSNAADGYYELDIKLPNGTTSVHHFYRLLGDVTGDGTVDSSDINAISAALNEKAATGMGALNVDVNGDGTVSALDLVLAMRSKGRKLASGLSLG